MLYEAKKALKELEIHPEDPDLWYKCGIWYLRMGFLDKYREFWTNFIENPPSRSVKRAVLDTYEDIFWLAIGLELLKMTPPELKNGKIKRHGRTIGAMTGDMRYRQHIMKSQIWIIPLRSFAGWEKAPKHSYLIRKVYALKWPENWQFLTVRVNENGGIYMNFAPKGSAIANRHARVVARRYEAMPYQIVELHESIEAIDDLLFDNLC